MQIQIRLSGAALPLAHISILPSIRFCHQINQTSSAGWSTKPGRAQRWGLLKTRWVECLFSVLSANPDYYICIYDSAGWHGIPQSSLLTYSSSPFLLLSTLPISLHFTHSPRQWQWDWVKIWMCGVSMHYNAPINRYAITSKKKKSLYWSYVHTCWTSFPNFWLMSPSLWISP